MRLCTNVLEVRQLCQMPAKGREGRTQPREMGKSMFLLEKGHMLPNAWRKQGAALTEQFHFLSSQPRKQMKIIAVD